MKNKYQEVELKFKLENKKETEERLRHIGALPENEVEYQKDTYYVPAHRDFFAEDVVSEWLRLRESNGKVQLNYKRWLPIGAKKQTHCEEYETNISDVIAVKRILYYLNFKEIVVVEKERKTWKYENFIISLDTVKELGCFIEIEYGEEVKEENVELILDSMCDFLKDVIHADVSERDRRGYPYQLLTMKGLI